MKNSDSTYESSPDELTSSKLRKETGRLQFHWKSDGIAILALVLMVVYFLHLSWRKWTDPLIDGYVWYNAWQLSHGAVLYHDVPLLYGPLAAQFDAVIFKLFGPGIMVLVTAHLVIYSLILGLIYFTFRIAWGRFSAFVASSVFISIFSFSQLQECGNFNFAAPYSHEIIHGTLVTLIAAIIAARWCRGKSAKFAFLFGLCFGLAAVLKPEFMLACAFLGLGILLVRQINHQTFSAKEFLVAFIGLIIPTFAFTTAFAQTRPWKQALIDASQAWWQAVVAHIQTASALQQNAIGLNDPLVNGVSELSATASAIIVIGCVWLIGWSFNRSWPTSKRIAASLVGLAIILVIGLRGDWFEVGLCLPGLIIILLCVLVRKLWFERHIASGTKQSTVMALMLTLVATAMLARMFLQARIYDFGFYQAAFAGMAIAAATVAYVPQWTGRGLWGSRVAMIGCVALFSLACLSIARDSRRVRLAQTQPIGSGADRIYSFNPNFNATGALANWVVEDLKTTSTNATVMVLPEGATINYLSRRKYPWHLWAPLDGGTTVEQAEQTISHLRQSPPDYIVFISRSMSEHGLKPLGTSGTPGIKTLRWIAENYETVAHKGGNFFDPKEKGAVILKRK